MKKAMLLVFLFVSPLVADTYADGYAKGFKDGVDAQFCLQMNDTLSIDRESVKYWSKAALDHSNDGDFYLGHMYESQVEVDEDLAILKKNGCVCNGGGSK